MSGLRVNLVSCTARIEQLIPNRVDKTSFMFRERKPLTFQDTMVKSLESGGQDKESEIIFSHLTQYLTSYLRTQNTFFKATSILVKFGYFANPTKVFDSLFRRLPAAREICNGADWIAKKVKSQPYAEKLCKSCSLHF